MLYQSDSDSVVREEDSDNCSSSSEIQSDEDQTEDEISFMVARINSIDIDMSTIKQALDITGDSYTRPPNSFSESSLLRYARNGLGLGTSRCSKSQLVEFNTDLADTRVTGDRERMLVDFLSRITRLTRRDATQSSQAKLPVELWAHIFSLCLPNEDFIRPDPREAPLILCQICSAWRRVAIDTPLLWSNLSIRGSWRRHLWKSSLECWLRRSENAVLSLDISIPPYMEPTFDIDIKKIILSSSNRWYHLRLNLPDNILRSMLSADMPVLNKLEFSSSYPIAPLDIQASHAPQFRTVSLLTKSLYPQLLSLPWHQLTNMSSQCWLNIGQHLDILRKCPRLESYGMCLVHTDIPPDSRPILMHHLRRLEIVVFTGSAMGPILGWLLLPNLTQLSFMVPSTSPACGQTGWPKLYVLSLVERSACKLKKIRLKGVDMAEESIQDTKKSIPTLVSVDVS